MSNVKYIAVRLSASQPRVAVPVELIGEPRSLFGRTEQVITPVGGAGESRIDADRLHESAADALKNE